MNGYTSLTEKMDEELLKVHQFKLDIWKEHVLFDWHWWFGIVLTILPLILWLIFRDKKLTAKLLLAGLTAVILSAFLDTTCLFFGLYDYRYEVTPMASNYIPWNFFTIPILIMFTIQLFNKINIYLKGIILAFFVSFIGLPTLNFIGIFNITDWHYAYSFICMIIIFVLSFQMSKVPKNNE